MRRWALHRRLHGLRGLPPGRLSWRVIRPLSCWISCRSRSVSFRREGVRLFNVTYFDGALAPLLDGTVRKCRIKYDPRNMSAVFVELPTGGHLRVPCADLGRPAVTLWEQRAAVQALRAEGRAGVDEAAIFTAIEAQRHVLAEARGRSKAARRAVARLPDGQPAATAPVQRPATEAIPDDTADVDEASVPCVVADEAWKTEFLS